MITTALEFAATSDSILDTFTFSYDEQVWTLLERLDSGKTFSAINADETELSYFTTEQLSDVVWSN